MIIKSSIELAINAMGDIFDVKLPAEDEGKIREILSRHEGNCIDFHRLRSRKSGSSRFIDMHIVVPRKWSIEEAHKESDLIESEIRQALPNTEVIIDIDPCSKALDPCSSCSQEEGQRHHKDPMINKRRVLSETRLRATCITTNETREERR